MGFWIEKIDSGMDVIVLAGRFNDSREFKVLYGVDLSNGEIIYIIYMTMYSAGSQQRWQ